MTTTVLSRAERLDRALSVLARRGTTTRMHRVLSAAAGAEIDRAAYLVLRRLHLDGPARITEIAAQMGVEPSTVSRHARMLERRGWLAKHEDASDGRAMVADVTGRGRAVVERIEAERRRILDEALAAWSDDDLDRFVVNMERFAHDLSDVLEPLT